MTPYSIKRARELTTFRSVKAIHSPMLHSQLPITGSGQRSNGASSLPQDDLVTPYRGADPTSMRPPRCLYSESLLDLRSLGTVYE